MKLILNKDLFLEKLNLTSHFTSDKIGTASVLQCAYLKNENNLLHFYSTNLSSYFHTQTKTDKKETFSMLIEPKKIIEFINFLNPGEIIIEFKEKQISIVQNKNKGVFPILPPEDFPLPPTLKEKPQSMKTNFFVKDLPLVIFAASRDESRPVLSGINFVGLENETDVVATDGFRLSLLKLKNFEEIGSMLIPAGFLTELIKYLKNEEQVKTVFSKEEKIILFQAGDNDFYTRLIEGEFPPYEKVIPAEIKTTAIIDKEELLKNIKLISVFARDTSNIIVCEFKENELFIVPKAEPGNENSAQQEIELKGEPQKVAFNYRFLLEFLNSIDSKRIEINILRSDAPVVFKTDKNPAFSHIIMPVRVQE